MAWAKMSKSHWACRGAGFSVEPRDEQEFRLEDFCIGSWSLAGKVALGSRRSGHRPAPQGLQGRVTRSAPRSMLVADSQC